jgi:holliday junction DNA helicase RuvA
MYAHIVGKIVEIKPSHLVIENQGIGYLIISPNPYSYKLYEEEKIYIHHYVREDIDNLYGFKTVESKELFIKLIGVSGIGPKSALSLLATDAIIEIMLAIEEGNIKFLTKFPGIGTKNAQQIILDLKGKLIVDEDAELLPTQRNDVEDALLALGYSKTEIRKVMKKVDIDTSIEVMIKSALKLLIK